MSYTRATHFPSDGVRGFQPTHDVARQTAERLKWRYGEARAWQIANGQCPNSRRDIAAWKSLGRGRAGA